MNFRVYEQDILGWKVISLGRLRYCGEIRAWCCATFGKSGERWRDNLVWGEIAFLTSEDVSMFLLKWGGDVAAPDH